MVCPVALYSLESDPNGLKFKRELIKTHPCKIIWHKMPSIDDLSPRFESSPKHHIVLLPRAKARTVQLTSIFSKLRGKKLLCVFSFIPVPEERLRQSLENSSYRCLTNGYGLSSDIAHSVMYYDGTLRSDQAKTLASFLCFQEKIPRLIQLYSFIHLYYIQIVRKISELYCKLINWR